MANSKFSNAYHRVVDNEYYFGTGSWAVVNKDIDMKLNSKGEYFPELLKPESQFSEMDAHSLRESCLSLSSQNESLIAKKQFSTIPNIKKDRELGYYSGLYVGHVVEGNFRKNGSSGGFGTWLAKELIQKEHVTGVLHILPNRSGENDGRLFKYEVSTNIEQLVEGAKTKYYPVEYSEVLNYVKCHPGKYVLVGLPSYIMEVRLLSMLDSTINERIKYTIGLVCGHEKSTKFAEFLAWQCGIKPGDLRNVNFRKKIEGSSADSYGIELTGLINGEEKTIVRRMSDLIGGDWGQGLFKVNASDFTDDVMNETADVTLGDAWLPEYTLDGGGNNIIIARNPTINQIIEEGIENGKVHLDKVNPDVIIRSQSAHYRHTYEELPYRLYKQKKNDVWVPKKRVSPSNNLPWIRRKIQDQRRKINSTVPKIYREAVKRNDINYFIKRIKPLDTEYHFLYKIQHLSRIPQKFKRLFVK